MASLKPAAAALQPRSRRRTKSETRTRNLPNEPGSLGPRPSRFSILQSRARQACEKNIIFSWPDSPSPARKGGVLSQTRQQAAYRAARRQAVPPHFLHPVAGGALQSA